LLSLSDDTGMIQHATFATPDRVHGYCTDDNARAVIAAVMYGRLRGFAEVLVPLQVYLAFLAYAFDPKTGRFRNFMSYDRRWIEDVGSQDSHGRAIWGLSVAARLAPNESARSVAEQLIRQALPATEKFDSIRAWAFTLTGLDVYLAQPGEGANRAQAAALRKKLAGKLFNAWERNAEDDWPWWEDELTYANAKLPHSLLVSGYGLGRDDMVAAGLRSLRWIMDVQMAEDGHLSIIGNRGWYTRGKRRAKFDQQPLEAHGLVHACLGAARVTGDAAWVAEAKRCFEWFLGWNDVGASLYNPETGGCQDGLNPSGVNENQGAESTLAYLLSVLELHRHEVEAGASVAAEPAHTVGYALVGASGFGEFALTQCAGMDGFNPVAVWSRTAANAARLAGRYGMQQCGSMEDLLADPRVGLVHVATVPSLHADQALAALAAHKNVLVEKPMALTHADARQMIDRARENDLVLNVDFTMRYGPLWGPVRELIVTELLGAALYGVVVNCAGDDKLTPDHWFWDESLSGGIFVEHGVHFFDLLRSWFGAGKVIGAHKHHRPKTTLVDQAHCTVVHDSHTCVDYYHGFHQPSCLDRQAIKLVFELGEVNLFGWVADRLEVRAALDEERIARLTGLFPGAKASTIRCFSGEGRRFFGRGNAYVLDCDVRLTWSQGQEPQATYGLALRALMRDTLAAIADRRHRMRVTSEDGLAALDMALAADRMAGESRP